MSGMTTPSYNHDFLNDTVGITQEFLSDIVIDILSLGDFTPEREFYWNKRITKITTDIGQFVELTTLLSKSVMARKSLSIAGIKESHVHLLFILKAMNQAQLKSDLIALDDLIKYELKDNLTQWKIDLIPQLKKALLT